MKPKKYIAFSSTIVIVILMITLIFHSQTAQLRYKLSNSTSFISLKGTSTMHDWQAEVTEISGLLNTEINHNQLLKITDLEIEVISESIKTGKNQMDANMYEALKTKSFPKISFKLKDHSFDNSSISITGDLNVAGVTKIIKTKIVAEMTTNQIKLTGRFKVRMTDFDIEPPKQFFGSIKTGDTVALKFLLVFNNSDNI